ncbi:MAG: DUF2855 family protein [Microscillaceae bacterium]
MSASLKLAAGGNSKLIIQKTQAMTKFTIQKNDISKISIHREEMPALKAGEVLFGIKKYAITANNLTYAVLGDKLRYWDFFPSHTETEGIIPVWGFAEVLASQHPQIALGEYCYGYFPMSAYLVVEAHKVTDFGFTDNAAHRKALSSVYNYYNRCTTDPSYRSDIEDFIPILKPLFVTSFLNYYFLEDAHFHQAEQIILTSASSKTGLGLAFMLKQHQAQAPKKILGLTSAANLEFVKKTGYYTEVLPYEELNQVALEDSLIVDFAGNAQHIKTLYAHLGAHLKYVSRVGLADWKATKDFKEIPNAELFFAPAFAKEKYEVWGIAETNQKIAQYFFRFAEAMQSTLEIHYLTNTDAVKAVYAQMLSGTLPPNKGYIVKMAAAL